MIKKRASKKGLTLIEVVIVMSLLSIVMLAVSQTFLFVNKQSLGARQKAFAAQKAIQMMEELRGLVANAGANDIGLLDNYDDGASYNPILTTRAEVTTAGDFLSGNAKGDYLRRVSVKPVANDALARHVSVRIYTAATKRQLAETASVLRTISTEYVKTQVYDVFVLALENVPGWWVALSSMKPMLDNIIQDLQTRNPGLEWRVHWITRSAYGRDPYYTPFVNETTKTNDTAPTDVYFYPGLNEDSGGDESFYYVPDFFQGRVNIDGMVENADSYSIADQYNHGVRYPDEEAIYNQAVATAKAAGQTPPEMSLRMLIEKMNSGSDEVENIMLINLHGELFPLPPIRNYSDAAKDPTDNSNVRVVTHPEHLDYASGSQVNLRVYPYVMNPGSWANDAALSTTTVLLKDVSLTSSDIDVRLVTGNNNANYQWSDAAYGTDFEVTNPGGTDTLITLYELPLRHPPRNNGSGGGLPTGERLYGLEYIPCLVQNASDFSEGTRDLDSNETNRAKNTARAVIQIASLALSDGEYAVETRIGDDLTTGTNTNKPENVSRTFIWIGEDAPFTEQYQFMGDMRHMPYADVKDNNGFNWWFRTVNSSDYPGFSSRDYNGYTGDKINVDVPRYWEIYRRGLLNSRGVMNTITGFSFYYVGLGGEIGDDIRIRERPWNASGNSVHRVNEILRGGNSSQRREVRLISNVGNTWWGLFWLGELYPDSDFSTWQTDGNLPVGSGGYYRAKYTAKGFSTGPGKRLGTKGCSGFFNGNTNGNNSNRFFNHDFGNNNTKGNIQTAGNAVAQDFNFPLLPKVSASRPFRLNHNSGSRKPPEWSKSEYSSQRTTLSTEEEYYNSTKGSNHDSSALVKVRRGSNAGYVVVNGVSTQGNFGAAQIGKLCVLSLARGFMKAGDPDISIGRIPQIPLVSISSPSITDQFVNPSTVTVSWQNSWTRWDAQRYTTDYSESHSETTTLITNIKYSDNNGKNWYLVQNDQSILAGEKDELQDTTSPYDWDVASLTEGKYLVRVEVFRDDIDLHHAYHQVAIHINR